ncbi:MAG: AAA family ATPase [Verrucomicrobia bacterium]|nr:AAA family ATPase [Verrucomicrobiota bacterium]
MSNTINGTTHPSIPKPASTVITPEQAKTDQSISDCQRAILNFDDYDLKRSVLGAISNRALDNESRLAIVNEIKQGHKHTPDDREEEDDGGLVIENARELIVKTIVTPPELIKGVLYQGGKMSYNAPSKMGKTWSLLHLGISISEGLDWFGFKTTKARVLFINPELQNFSFEKRVQLLGRNLNGVTVLENFDYVSTRGKQLSSTKLIPLLEKKIKTGQYGAIILDSIYKLYPDDTEENSNSDIGRFMGGLEKLANYTGAAIIFSHHYSKGNQAKKAAIDRPGGAGTWGRDPDTVISATEHEKEQCYSVEFNLRDFPPINPITIRVNWPNVVRDTSLDPKKLKTTQFPAKYSHTDILKLLIVKPYTTTELQNEVKSELGMSSTTFYALLPAVQKTEGVKKGKDNRWSYITPACNPANN